jgi:hypothetical protein
VVRSSLTGSNVQRLAHVTIPTHFGSHFLLSSNVPIGQRSSHHARLPPTWVRLSRVELNTRNPSLLVLQEPLRACHNPSTNRFTQRKCNGIRRSSCVMGTF